MSVLNMAGHQVQTSVASLLERQWRLNTFETRYILGCASCPCDIASCPSPDAVFEITGDDDGDVQTEILNLSCVATGNDGERNITINLIPRGCTFGGVCSGVRPDVNTKMYLTLCDDDDGEKFSGLGEDWNPSQNATEKKRDKRVVRIFLENNGVPVTEDEFGNPVQPFYLIGVGQLKYLCIVNGALTRVTN
jgi:hypothetical protein